MRVSVRFMVLWTMALLCGAQTSAARVTYSRAFQGSDPAFFQISVTRDGVGEFQAREQDDSPTVTLPFTATPALVEQIFALTAQLRDFESPGLESKAKVAFSGAKTLTFDAGTRHISQTFNFTVVPAAARLSALFESVGASGAHTIRLQRVMRFDHLGVGEEVYQIQRDWDAHALAEPQLLLPTLQQLADGPAYLISARQRARGLIEKMSLADSPPH